MDTKRFDRFTTNLARRLPRRALAAQDATPPAPTVPPPSAIPDPLGLPEGERTSFLFVQTAQGGTWAPKEGEDGVYTLTLTGAAAQTVYFSDRPERIVGAVPTARFLDSLGFAPDNPPNAALVAQREAGEDIVVVELLDPVYTEGSGSDGAVTLTYEARILDDYAGEGLAHLAARQADAMPPESFDAASLFIDDCADQLVICKGPNSDVGSLGPYGFCWSFGDVCCQPCQGHNWPAICNDTFPACEGKCRAGESHCW